MIGKFLHDMSLDGIEVQEFPNFYRLPVSFDYILEVVMTKQYLRVSVNYLGSTRLSYFSYHYVQGKWCLYKVGVFRDGEESRVTLDLVGQDVVVGNTSILV